MSGKPLTEHEKKGLNAPGKPQFLDCYRQIDKSLSKLAYEGFTYIDLSGVFDHETKDIFIDTVHFADRGNMIVGGKIVELLLSSVSRWHPSW